MGLLLACATCFGAADSEQVKAAKVGVLVLLGFIVPLLVAIAFTARSWAKRAKALEAADQAPSTPSLRVGVQAELGGLGVLGVGPTAFPR
jgi:hypothetical protein